VKTFRAKSLKQFLKHVHTLDKKWRDQKGRSIELWFRGQREDVIPKPKLYRGTFRAKSADTELRIEFQRRGVQFAQGRVLSDQWERYFLMQHFGAPTRLLDWTDGALLALYFAVRDEITAEKTPRQAVVWALDPSALNKLVMGWRAIALPGWKEVKPWLPKDPLATIQPRFPIAIDPTHVDLRLAVQRSHFTLFGRSKDGLADLVRRHGKRLRLARIVVKGKKRVRRIVEELEACGIRETSVFPDLEGLSREITDEWRK
jgi:hypothetical protein